MAPQVALCIDPDAGTVALLRRVLEPVGFRVESIPNWNDAIEWGRANKPAIVILSVEPFGVGYAICNRLRRNPDLGVVPILLMTADEKPETLEQHKKLKARADAYMRKPLDERVLLENVSKLVDIPPAAVEAVRDLDPAIGFLASSDGVVTPVAGPFKQAEYAKVAEIHETPRYVFPKYEFLLKVEIPKFEPVLEIPKFEPVKFDPAMFEIPEYEPFHRPAAGPPLLRVPPPPPPAPPPAPSGGWLKQVGFVLLGLLASLIGC